MESEIVLSKISKSFNGNKVLDNFSYTFKYSNIYKLVGPNGSGKTTLLKIIKGIYLPDSGEILLNPTLRNNVSYIDNNPRSFFHRLNVKDNLDYFLSLYSPNYDTQFAEELVDFFEISHLKNTLFSDLSQGQMQLISIIRGVANKSTVIILDESFSFLDIKIKSKLESFLIEKNIQDKSLVLFCSHDEIFAEAEFIELRM